MHLVELAPYVALIVDDAERRFGTDAHSPLRDTYAHEVVLDLWLTQAGLTVTAARDLLRQVHGELRRRSASRQETAELWTPA